MVPRENKKILIRILGGQTKSIMVFSKVAYRRLVGAFGFFPWYPRFTIEQNITYYASVCITLSSIFLSLAG